MLCFALAFLGQRIGQTDLYFLVNVQTGRKALKPHLTVFNLQNDTSMKQGKPSNVHMQAYEIWLSQDKFRTFATYVDFDFYQSLHVISWATLSLKTRPSSQAVLVCWYNVSYNSTLETWLLKPNILKSKQRSVAFLYYGTCDCRMEKKSNVYCICYL